MTGSLRIATAATVALVAGCSRCESPASDAPDGAADAIAIAVDAIARIAPIAMEDLPSARGLGIPRGCRLELPVQRARVDDDVRFFSASADARELVLARGDAEGTVQARGILPLGATTVRDFPWTRFLAPPAADRAAAGWVAAWDVVAGSSRRAVVWTERGGARGSITGDHLAVADLGCVADRCAILTTLARPAIAPGATLLHGPATDPPEQWTRVDLEANPGEPWQPLRLVSLSSETTWVALRSEKRVALWRIDGTEARETKIIEAPHGVLDVVRAGDTPVVVAAGRPMDECTTSRFPMTVENVRGERFDVSAQANPYGAVARPLKSGAFVTWVAPIACQTESRSIVHALLLGPGGEPASSVMAVAHASGVALAASGDRVDLWLRTDEGITWLRADCQPQASDAATKAPPR